jgi:D-aspartate ligase
MKFKQQQFVPLLFAGDINSYSMSRAFYEAYQVRSIVYGKLYTGPNCNSKISDYRALEDIEKEDVFLNTVNKVAREYKDKKVLVIPCGDSYVSLVAKLREKFEKNVVTIDTDYNQIRELTLKENFYNLCKKYNLDYPKTFVYSKNMGKSVEHGFSYPVILKPSDGIKYWEHPFETQKKVYKIHNQEQLHKVIKEIYDAGYPDKLIIQDMIPGDDTFMYVLTGYSDRKGKVKLLALGNVLREEHTPHGLGNHSVIINEVNEEISMKVKEFLEDIKYVGFFNFDIKFDSRDGKYKFFEINTRQGRSNYYVTGAGYNLTEYVVKEYIENKDLEYTLATNKKLWLVIPIILALIYIKNYRKEMILLILKGDVINPVFNIKDMGFIRFLRFFKTHISHFRKMRLE